MRVSSVCSCVEECNDENDDPDDVMVNDMGKDKDMHGESTGWPEDHQKTGCSTTRTAVTHFFEKGLSSTVKYLCCRHSRLGGIRVDPV